MEVAHNLLWDAGSNPVFLFFISHNEEQKT